MNLTRSTMKFNKSLLYIGTIGLIFSVSSCKSEDIEDDKSQTGIEIIKDANKSFNTTFDGKLFSVPSPIQTALLIKSLSIPFNEVLLNDKENIDQYTLPEAKAINLGIYSADLGYISLYNQNAKTLSYVNLIESLADDLGISGAFDRSFMERFERNSNNEDSLLVIISDGLRQADNFLKENEQNNISSLILTGGWIESMYIASQLNKIDNSEEILMRIGEQYQTIKTIIELLEKYNTDGQNNEYLHMFEDLKSSFSKIESTYVYADPETDVENKITTIKSKMNIVISEELLEEITDKISAIRNNVTKSL